MNRLKSMALSLFLCLTLTVSAQSDYEISRYTIDGGGTTSSGGDYTLSGTIGQSDASLVSHVGLAYTLEGGFWHGIDICTVDVDDLKNFLAQWLTQGPNNPADFNADDIVDMYDFRWIHQYWLENCPQNWPF